MPRDPESEFHTDLIRALARLVAAHQVGSPEQSVAALQRLLDLITAHGTIESRKSAALARALDRL